MVQGLSHYMFTYSSFGKETGKLDAVDGLLDDWVKENSDLKSFVDAEREVNGYISIFDGPLIHYFR